MNPFNELYNPYPGLLILLVSYSSTRGTELHRDRRDTVHTPLTRHTRCMDTKQLTRSVSLEVIKDRIDIETHID